MFVQDYQDGKIYRELLNMQYVLKIDGQKFYGENIEDVLEQYSDYQYENIAKAEG